MSHSSAILQINATLLSHICSTVRVPCETGVEASHLQRSAVCINFPHWLDAHLIDTSKVCFSRQHGNKVPEVEMPILSWTV